MDAVKLAAGLIAEAYAKGLTPTNPINIEMWTDDAGVATKKYVCVSFTSPARPYEGLIWVNPTNRELYEYNVATGTWVDTEDEKDPLEAGKVFATVEYVDSKMTQAVSMSQAIIAQPIATVNDLRNLNMTNVKDKQMIYVEELNRVYAYDLQGIGDDDNGQTVVTPAGGIGRWFPTTPGNLDGGEF
jgi:hypothetical protein